MSSVPLFLNFPLFVLFFINLAGAMRMSLCNKHFPRPFSFANLLPLSALHGGGYRIASNRGRRAKYGACLGQDEGVRLRGNGLQKNGTSIVSHCTRRITFVANMIGHNDPTTERNGQTVSVAKAKTCTEIVREAQKIFAGHLYAYGSRNSLKAL